MGRLTPPSMRRHLRGYYFVHWGGKDHYLGSEKQRAEKLYLQSLKDWAEWRRSRDAARHQQRRAERFGAEMTVLDFAEEFLDLKLRVSGADVWRYYRKHVARFVRAWGPARLNTIRAPRLQILVDEMQAAGYAPATINHDIGAVKTMLRRAMGLEYMPVVALEVVKKLPTGPPPDKSLPADDLRKVIAGLDPAREQPWCAIAYLCAMRPSEVVRVVAGQGRWIERWAFELDRGKTDMKARMKRVIPFSEEALAWLAHCQRIWSRLDSFSSAVRAACGFGPSVFRHCAATHLHRAGVPLVDVGLLLGHSPRGVILRYTPIDYGALREKISLLRLQFAPLRSRRNSSV